MQPFVCRPAFGRFTRAVGSISLRGLTVCLTRPTGNVIRATWGAECVATPAATTPRQHRMVWLPRPSTACVSTIHMHMRLQGTSLSIAFSRYGKRTENKPCVACSGTYSQPRWQEGHSISQLPAWLDHEVVMSDAAGWWDGARYVAQRGGQCSAHTRPKHPKSRRTRLNAGGPHPHQ
jgi:hypothetical protein